MSNPQSSAPSAATSSNSTPTKSEDPSPTLRPLPFPATNSPQTAVTFATPSSGIPHPRPNKSIKRRPPTPGGPSSVDAFQKVARLQLLQPHPELPRHSPAPSSRIPLTSFTVAGTGLAFSTAPQDEVVLPSSHPESPTRREQAPKPHRRKPSRLNLASISNHGSLPPSPSNAQLHSPTSPSGPAPAVLPGPVPSTAQDPTSRAYQAASSPSHPGHQGHHLKRRGTIDSEDSPDGHSVTSTNLDSPSTKAMMERLLSAPDYFTLHDPRYVDDDDDDSSGSLKFATVGEDREKEDRHEDKRLRNVREQRERSKIQKLLGNDVGDSAGSLSRPRRVDGFWSDSDFKPGVSAGNVGSAEIGAPASPSWKRKRSVPSGFKALEPKSPKAAAFWSSSAPPLGSPHANERYDNSQERLLLPRASQDSRYRSTSKEPNLNSPPASPRERHLSSDSNRHPRVHALDALRPGAATVKGSKTMSGAIATSHPNPEAIIPPPRLSSRNALNAQKATADGHVGKEAGIDARTRVKPSKSAKSLSISQSEPHHHQTPAGVIVEEYKRQILDTQKATPSSKESKRLSALQWMIEQTKSVTRSRSASASVPPSPHSSNQSMSPPFSVTNFARSQAIARSRSAMPATTVEQHLSPGGPSMQPLPSPMSVFSANNSSSSLLSPEARFGRPAPVYPTSRQRARGEALSPVLASAAVQPPDSPWDGSSSLLVPGSPRSEGHQSSETGHYVPARSHPGYWSSGEMKGSEKEKRGMVAGLGKKLSKRKLNKRKDEGGEKEGQDGQSRSRVRGRSGTRDGGAQSDTQAQRLPRRGVSVDRPPTLHHRKSLRLSIDKFADDANVSQSPSSFRGVSSPAYRSISSPGQSSPQVDTPTKSSRKESGGSKQFWKFVKRIGSSGGLQDKYQSSPYAAMPTPPTHTPESAHTPVSAEVDGNQGLSRGRRTSVEQVASLNTGTPAKTPASTPGLKHASSSADGHNSYYAHSRGHQNINTRSSTLGSSDPVSSSRVFQRTHSSRSSESSVIELGNPPPLPTHPPSAFLSQRFGPWSENGNHSDGSYRPSPGRTLSLRTRKSSTNTTKTATEEDWMASELTTPSSPPSLPTPPRRPKPAISTSLEDLASRPDEASDFESESPLIPVFTVDNAINQFKPRKRSDAAQLDERYGHNTMPFSTSISTNTNVYPVHQLEAFPAAVSSPMSLSRSISVQPPPRPARDARRLVSPSRTSPSGPQANQDSSSSSADSSPALKGKLKKSNSKSKKDKPVSAGYPSKPPTSAFGPSPGFSKNNSCATPTPNLPSSSQHALSNPSSPLVASPQSANPRSPASDFVSVEFRERSSLQLNRGLSEQEKAEKWDALLEKSEQAGGTLHLTLGLSAGQLDSDQLTLNSSISVDP